MKLRLAAVAALTAGFLLTPFAKADSVIYEGHSGDAYTYDLQIDNYGAAFLLSGFEINGLSGVTDAYLTGSLASVFDPLGGASYTSTSVNVGTLFGLTFGFSNPYSIGTLTVDSASLPGLASFELGDSNGFNTGAVEGPVSSTPEPSSLLLFGTGILAAAGAVRRRLTA